MVQPTRTAEPKRKFVALETLRLRDFRFLWVSNGLTFMGHQMRIMAQGWLVLEMTDSSLWVGAAQGIPAIPVILLSLTGGVLADRMDRRRLLIQVRLMMAALAFITGFLVTTGEIQVWHIMVLAVAAGSVNAFGMPAAHTFVFDIVGRERLLSAISLNSSLTNFMTMIGPSIGGILIARFSTGVVFNLVGASLVLASIAVSFVNIRRAPVTSGRKPMIQDLADGLSYVHRTPQVALLLFLGITVLAASIYYPLVPVFARDVLDAGPQGYGLLLAGYGFGGLVGSLGLVAMGSVRRKARIILMDGIVWSTGMVIFAFSRDLWLSVACSTVMGAMAMLWTNAMTTLLQTSVPEEMRGRIMSMFMLTMQTVPLAWLLGGALGETLGYEVALIVGAALFFTGNVVPFVRSRALREME